MNRPRPALRPVPAAATAALRTGSVDVGMTGNGAIAALVAELDGDRGAADYLRRHDAETIECADLATGQDVDRPQA